MVSCNRNNEKTQPTWFSLCITSPEDATHRSTIPASFCNLSIALMTTLPLTANSYIGIGKRIAIFFEKFIKRTEHFT